MKQMKTALIMISLAIVSAFGLHAQTNNPPAPNMSPSSGIYDNTFSVYVQRGTSRIRDRLLDEDTTVLTTSNGIFAIAGSGDPAYNDVGRVPSRGGKICRHALVSLKTCPTRILLILKTV